jgi:DNA-binding MarR family transcriptional regulator
MLIIRGSDNMTQNPTLPNFLATSLGFLLGKLSQRLIRQAEAALSGLGLQTKQVGVLTLISDSGPMSQKEIGDRLEIDRTTMVSLVDGLERDELVARKPDSSDRRAFLVTLTAKGKRALGKAHEIVAATEQKFLHRLSDGERKQVLTLLGTLFNGDDR